MVEEADLVKILVVTEKMALVPGASLWVEVVVVRADVLSILVGLRSVKDTSPQACLSPTTHPKWLETPSYASERLYPKTVPL